MSLAEQPVRLLLAPSGNTKSNLSAASVLNRQHNTATCGVREREGRKVCVV